MQKLILHHREKKKLSTGFKVGPRKSRIKHTQKRSQTTMIPKTDHLPEKLTYNNSHFQNSLKFQICENNSIFYAMYHIKKSEIVTPFLLKNKKKTKKNCPKKKSLSPARCTLSLETTRKNSICCSVQVMRKENPA